MTESIINNKPLCTVEIKWGLGRKDSGTVGPKYSLLHCIFHTAIDGGEYHVPGYIVVTVIMTSSVLRYCRLSSIFQLSDPVDIAFILWR